MIITIGKQYFATFYLLSNLQKKKFVLIDTGNKFLLKTKKKIFEFHLLIAS